MSESGGREPESDTALGRLPGGSSVSISAGQLAQPHPPLRSEPVGHLLLQEKLEVVPDAWAALRAAWDCIEPDGLLTVRYGGGPGWQLADESVNTLLRLAGFSSREQQKSGKAIEVRAQRIPRDARQLSCSVIVPCRNEAGNVSDLVRRVPSMGTHTETIFVDGGSTDGTVGLIEKEIKDHPGLDITLLHQRGAGGKAAAVFQGFDAARGDIMMILDADMTVAPEDLPRFYFALAETVADFANGNRFAYPMETGAMRPLNNAGNRVFGFFFSWLLSADIGDSLCGTKALFRADWPALSHARPLFGGHDPWGDFDLLLGAAYAGLRLIDIPVAYRARTAGESKMQPFRHGAALGRTCLAGIRRLKLEQHQVIRQGH